MLNNPGSIVGEKLDKKKL